MENIDSTQTLKEIVDTDTAMKNWLVDYVGNQHDPENNEVTVEMIVETMAREFPEFLLAIAEENWVRGYHQAIEDIEAGRQALEEQDEE